MSGHGGPPVLGIDLGGTKVLAAVTGPGHEVLGRAKRSTPAKEGGDAILATILEATDEALSASGLKRGDVAAAEVGSPGPLDTETGVILFSSNMNVKDFALGPRLSEALGVPVAVNNDVVAGGYGEFKLGAGRGHQNLIAAFVGTGIGGCLVLDGKLVRGATGNAGEIGHVVVKANGPKCGCGSLGCMEALASRTAIARRVLKAVHQGKASSLADKVTRKGGRLKSGEIAEAVASGDAVAVRSVERAAYYLGLGLGSFLNILGPEVVVVGGGVAAALGEPWVEKVRATAREQALVKTPEATNIVLAALGDDAGILGASLLAREKFVAGSTGG